MFYFVATFTGRHDSQHNDIQHNDTQHNDTQHKDIKRNDTQHKDIKRNNTQQSFQIIPTLCITAFNGVMLSVIMLNAI